MKSKNQCNDLLTKKVLKRAVKRVVKKGLQQNETVKKLKLVREKYQKDVKKIGEQIRKVLSTILKLREERKSIIENHRTTLRELGVKSRPKTQKKKTHETQETHEQPPMEL